MKKKFYLKSVAWLLLFMQTSVWSWADFRNPISFNRDQTTVGTTSEFVFRNNPDEILVPVYLIGAINKPGLYHIPKHTDLVSLLALSGGTLKEADVENIMIKNQLNQAMTKIDLEQVLKSPDIKPPLLSNNDIIFVKTREPSISSDTILKVTLVSSILGIIVSGVLISQAVRSK